MFAYDCWQILLSTNSAKGWLFFSHSLLWILSQLYTITVFYLWGYSAHFIYLRGALKTISCSKGDVSQKTLFKDSHMSRFLQKSQESHLFLYSGGRQIKNKMMMNVAIDKQSSWSWRLTNSLLRIFPFWKNIFELSGVLLQSLSKPYIFLHRTFTVNKLKKVSDLFKRAGCCLSTRFSIWFE